MQERHGSCHGLHVVERVHCSSRTSDTTAVKEHSTAPAMVPLAWLESTALAEHLILEPYKKDMALAGHSPQWRFYCSCSKPHTRTVEKQQGSIFGLSLMYRVWFILAVRIVQDWPGAPPLEAPAVDRLKEQDTLKVHKMPTRMVGDFNSAPEQNWQRHLMSG